MSDKVTTTTTSNSTWALQNMKHAGGFDSKALQTIVFDGTITEILINTGDSVAAGSGKIQISRRPNGVLPSVGGTEETFNQTVAGVEVIPYNLAVSKGDAFTWRGKIANTTTMTITLKIEYDLV